MSRPRLSNAWVWIQFGAVVLASRTWTRLPRGVGLVGPGAAIGVGCAGQVTAKIVRPGRGVAGRIGERGYLSKVLVRVIMRTTRGGVLDSADLTQNVYVARREMALGSLTVCCTPT